MRRLKIIGIVLFSVPVALFIIGYAWYSHRYPYGSSHCCDIMLSMELMEYAEKHNKWFPRGEATPEASLSLVYRFAPDHSGLANLLRGKTVATQVVKERFDRGELLSPETCGWHYVEGLRRDDDGRLALFWDKVGLGHNGERLSDGGHHVCFVTGYTEYVPGARWEKFLAEQEELKKAIKRPQ